MIAIILLNIANLGGAPLASALYVLLGRNLLPASLALITCLNLATRGYDHATSGEDRRLFDWTISGLTLLGPVLGVAEVLGLVGVLALGASAGDTLVLAVLQVAGLLVTLVATGWALYRVGAHEPLVDVRAVGGEATPPTVVA